MKQSLPSRSLESIEDPLELGDILFAQMHVVHKMRARRNSDLVEGLTAMECHVLMAIHHLGKEGDEVRPTAVGEIAHFSPASLSQHLSSLESKELINRSSSPTDSRAITLSLTNEGVASVSHVQSVMRENMSGLVDYLGVEKTRDFISTLKDMQDYLGGQGGATCG